MTIRPFFNPEEIYEKKLRRRLWGEFKTLVAESHALANVRVTCGKVHGNRDDGNGWFFIGSVETVADRLGFDLARYTDGED